MYIYNIKKKDNNFIQSFIFNKTHNKTPVLDYHKEDLLSFCRRIKGSLILEVQIVTILKSTLIPSLYFHHTDLLLHHQVEWHLNYHQS